MPINEADPCRTYVLLKLYGTGRKDSQISELKSLTDRRIVVINNRAIARKQKRAEYLLRCRSDSSIAVQHWAVLRTKAEQGLGRETLNHLKCYLTDICKTAVAEGYLHHNVSEGLKAPIALVKQSPSKAVVSMQQYVQAWKLLGERERLCFDLVMFAGMRESEVLALWCGDVRRDGLQIDRSWYRGEYRPPKSPKSERTVGVPESIMDRLLAWIEKLPVSGRNDCVFPSTKLNAPIWAGTVLTKHVQPRLSPHGLAWITFAVLRRSHSTLHKMRRSDLKIIADQQGHGMRTHLDDYVQSGVSERKREATKLYAEFEELLRKRG